MEMKEDEEDRGKTTCRNGSLKGVELPDYLHSNFEELYVPGLSNYFAEMNEQNTSDSEIHISYKKTIISLEPQLS